MPGNTLPLNRLSQQLIRDFHLTFNKKCRDLLLQIFGHESLIANKDTADIAHCTLLNEDFYRMSTLRWEHFALRKLLNPFKWLELLLTAPLETLSWSVWQFEKFITDKNKWLAPIQNRYLSSSLLFIRDTFHYLLSIAALIVNIAVNLATGILRRFLAPVRYIIRPAIETARKYPKSFSAIVAISLSIGIALTVTILTGGLPAILGGLFLAGSLAIKLTAVGIAATALGAFLTKGFNTLRELADAVQSTRNAPRGRVQMRGVDERSQQCDYELKLLVTGDPIFNFDTLFHDFPQLTDELIAPLLIIDGGDNVFIYGRSGDGKWQLKKLKTNYPNSKKIYDSVLRSTPRLNAISALDIRKLEQGTRDNIYEDINIVRGHIPEKTGSTDKITEVFHAIDIEHTEVRPVTRQDKWYTAALVTGTESIFFPKKTPLPVSSETNRTSADLEPSPPPSAFL